MRLNLAARKANFWHARVARKDLLYSKNGWAGIETGFDPLSRHCWAQTCENQGSNPPKARQWWDIPLFICWFKTWCKTISSPLWDKLKHFSYGARRKDCKDYTISSKAWVSLYADIWVSAMQHCDDAHYISQVIHPQRLSFDPSQHSKHLQGHSCPCTYACCRRIPWLCDRVKCYTKWHMHDKQLHSQQADVGILKDLP